MDREQGRPAIRVAVAAAFEEIHGLNESAAEYADEFEVCAVISTAAAVIEQTRRLQPEVLLLSEDLGFDDLETLALLTAIAPTTRLIGLVRSPAGRRLGIADALVRLDAPAAELRAAIVAAAERGQADAAPPAHSRADDGRVLAGEPWPPPWLVTAPGREQVRGSGSKPDRMARGRDPAFTIDGPEPVLTPAPRSVGSPVGIDQAPGVSLPDDHRLEAPAEPQPESAEPAIDPGQAGSTTARTALIFSGKGGVGKSVVATNLATALSMDGARVALVDLNLQYGDVGMLLHLEAHPTSIAAVVAEGDKVDAEFLGQALAVAPENVHVLLAPSSPELGDLVTAAGLRAILLELSRHHDYIVVDSPAHLEERILAVVDVADQILLVTSFSLTSVKDTKVTLRLLQSLGTDPERVAVVLNQTRAKVGYAADEIERALRFAVLATLPYEPRMEESLDTGRPMVVTEPHSRFSRQLRVIADHLGREAGVALEGKRREPPGRRRMRLGR